MNLYEYQRSRSFTDPGPRSLRFKIFKILFLETAGPIKAKFHVEPPWDLGTKVYTNGPGHMTNMAVMLSYGKDLKKIFFSGVTVYLVPPPPPPGILSPGTILPRGKVSHPGLSCPRGHFTP